MAASLFAGTQGITARRFGLGAAAAGITWKTDAGWTGPVITLETPAAQLAVALDLLRLALAEPVFQPAAGHRPDTARRRPPDPGRRRPADQGEAGTARRDLRRGLPGWPARPTAPPRPSRQLTPDDIAGFYGTSTARSDHDRHRRGP